MIPQTGKSDQREPTDEADVVAQTGWDDPHPLSLVAVAGLPKGGPCRLEKPGALGDCDPATDHDHARIEDVDHGDHCGGEGTPGVLHDLVGVAVALVLELGHTTRVDFAGVDLAES